MFWPCKSRIELRIESRAVAFFAVLFAFVFSAASSDDAEVLFRDRVKPILEEYCFDCHADGARKGSVSFDEFQSAEELLQPQLWAKVLKNVRAGIMPPAKKAQPTSEQREVLERWIKHSVFRIDPQNPDPGRVVVRRLNRVEYRNTVRDLMGVEYDTDNQFPADDSGHGFDNMASVLTISPMLMEKYLDAAREIVGRAVPSAPGVVAERALDGRTFAPDSGGKGNGGYALSYYEPAAVSNSFNVVHAGRYELVLNVTTIERYVLEKFDYNRCRLTFQVDGEELLRREFSREGAKPYAFKFARDWQSGPHRMELRLEPLTQEPQIRSLQLRLNSVVVRGPFAEAHFVKPRNYDRFFPKPVPSEAAERRTYARSLLAEFAGKAFRRPADEASVKRLAQLAEAIYSEPGQTFETGISHAMTAVLASPRFLFREEWAEAVDEGKFPKLDEFSLASRLSYFLWSSMPDDELLRAARAGALRTNLHAQVKRMLADRRAQQFVRNFGGQWLQTRDIDTVPINPLAIQAREPSFDPHPVDFDGELRRLMREETELYFDHVVRNDRSVLEFIESDYTFLNESLAAHYGLKELEVKGSKFRRVTLPAGSPRGGILTHGSVLTVTSNPTRTSPVKRGVFVLENILGTPPPPPPPNLPPLEDSGGSTNDRPLTLREALAVHRADAACSSCHNRMDPLGLAFENFNAMGMYRTQELAVPIDASGKLITGESFEGIQELKKILVTRHARSFYETIAEKLLTYAIGRGLEPFDIETVDQIAHRLEREEGKFSALLMGVIESAPFQRTRQTALTAASERKNEQAKVP